MTVSLQAEARHTLSVISIPDGQKIYKKEGSWRAFPQNSKRSQQADHIYGTPKSIPYLNT